MKKTFTKSEIKVIAYANDLFNKIETALLWLANNRTTGTQYNQFLSWSLTDCKNVMQFCVLIGSDNQFKKGFKKLRYLGKECGLISIKLSKAL